MPPPPLINALLDFILPSQCPGCRHNDGPLLCDDCQLLMPTLDAPCPNCALPLSENECTRCHGRGFAGIHQIICTWRYTGLCRDLILASKIREDMAAIKSLQNMLPINELMPYDAICSIPRSSGRRPGPHLANNLARYIAQQQKTPFTKLLRHTRLPAAQHELPVSMRRKNTHNLFTIRPTQHPTLPQRILLVDDLITSGHTISAAAQCLKQNGVKRVDVLCLARAI